MPTLQKFEDMEIWQRARKLAARVYDCTKLRDFAKDFGLKDQIRRAAISVMSNVAEGFDRSGNREFVQFLTVAKGSVGELRSQLYIALDQKYIGQSEFDLIARETEEIGRMIVGFIKYLQKSTIRGSKFKTD